MYKKIDNKIIYNIILCSKGTMNTQEQQELCDYINTLDNDIKQNKFISLARSHGIIPLVYKNLQKISQNIKNQQLLEKLQSNYKAIAQKNILMSAELLKIAKLLNQENIPYLAFKGPTLAQLAYGDITMRQFGDLDILIDKKDIYKLDKVLQDHDYVRFLELSSKQEEIWIANAHDMGYIHPSKKILLEMHWDFLDIDYPLSIDLKKFWNDSKLISINKTDILTFSNEKLLYYLCIHGSKHLWERIEWIKDIDLLIRTQEINWDQLSKNIDVDFQKMFYLGLLLSYKIYDTKLPIDIQKKIQRYNLDTLIDYIIKSWDTEQTKFIQTSMMLKLFPTIKTKILYLHKIILKPSMNEYMYISLPSYLYPLYYLIRPYLLIKKYLHLK